MKGRFFYKLIDGFNDKGWTSKYRIVIVFKGEGEFNESRIMSKEFDPKKGDALPLDKDKEMFEIIEYANIGLIFINKENDYKNIEELLYNSLHKGMIYVNM